MDISSLLISFTMLLIVAIFVIRPPMSGPQSDTSYPEHLPESETLLARHAAAMEALTDLDLDHATGKIGAEDYVAERLQLVAEGVDVLKQLDALDITVRWREEVPEESN